MIHPEAKPPAGTKNTTERKIHRDDKQIRFCHLRFCFPMIYPQCGGCSHVYHEFSVSSRFCPDAKADLPILPPKANCARESPGAKRRRTMPKKHTCFLHPLMVELQDYRQQGLWIRLEASPEVTESLSAATRVRESISYADRGYTCPLSDFPS